MWNVCNYGCIVCMNSGCIIIIILIRKNFVATSGLPVTGKSKRLFAEVSKSHFIEFDEKLEFNKTYS
jgi:hypothetical protein